MNRIALAALLVLLVSCSAPASPAPPPPSTSEAPPDPAPVPATLLTADDAHRLGFTSTAAPQNGPKQLIGACRLPSDAHIVQTQQNNWYTGDILSAGVSLRQVTAQYDGAVDVVGEFRMGCAKGAEVPFAPGAASCTETESAFDERTCVLVVAHGDLVTAAVLDVTGNAPGKVRTTAQNALTALTALLPTAVSRA
ncbi:hypothetical protein [Amycolatopsis tucumanensis]|uniref:hypothetical protein n=1 Tax=Amycolatopsis tucumanensis TaxID=401106 RepID=UPI003D712D2B